MDMTMDDIRFGKVYVHKESNEEYIPMYRSSVLCAEEPTLVTLKNQKTDKLLTVHISDFEKLFKDKELKEYEFLIADTRTKPIRIMATTSEKAYKIVQRMLDEGSLKLEEEDSNGIEIL